MPLPAPPPTLPSPLTHANANGNGKPPQYTPAPRFSRSPSPSPSPITTPQNVFPPQVPAGVLEELGRLREENARLTTENHVLRTALLQSNANGNPPRPQSHSPHPPTSHSPNGFAQMVIPRPQYPPHYFPLPPQPQPTSPRLPQVPAALAQAPPRPPSWDTQRSPILDGWMGGGAVVVDAGERERRRVEMMGAVLKRRLSVSAQGEGVGVGGGERSIPSVVLSDSDAGEVSILSEGRGSGDLLSLGAIESLPSPMNTTSTSADESDDGEREESPSFLLADNSSPSKYPADPSQHSLSNTAPNSIPSSSISALPLSSSSSNESPFPLPLGASHTLPNLHLSDLSGLGIRPKPSRLPSLDTLPTLPTPEELDELDRLLISTSTPPRPSSRLDNYDDSDSDEEEGEGEMEGKEGRRRSVTLCTSEPRVEADESGKRGFGFEDGIGA